MKHILLILVVLFSWNPASGQVTISTDVHGDLSNWRRTKTLVTMSDGSLGALLRPSAADYSDYYVSTNFGSTWSLAIPNLFGPTFTRPRDQCLAVRADTVYATYGGESLQDSVHIAKIYQGTRVLLDTIGDFGKMRLQFARPALGFHADSVITLLRSVGTGVYIRKSQGSLAQNTVWNLGDSTTTGDHHSAGIAMNNGIARMSGSTYRNLQFTDGINFDEIASDILGVTPENVAAISKVSGSIIDSMLYIAYEAGDSVNYLAGKITANGPTWDWTPLDSVYGIVPFNGKMKRGGFVDQGGSGWPQVYPSLSMANDGRYLFLWYKQMVDTLTPDSFNLYYRYRDMDAGTWTQPTLLTAVYNDSLDDLSAPMFFESQAFPGGHSLYPWVAWKTSPGSTSSALRMIMDTVTIGQSHVPVLDPIGPKSIVRNSTLDFTVTATDPDSTIPFLISSNLPIGATFSDNLDGTGAFNWTPDSNQVGVHSILFQAFDGVFDDTELVVITVSDSLQPSLLVSQVGPWTTGLSHAVGAGGNRLLLFTVGWEDVQSGADRPIASVDYGGRPMTQIIRQGQAAYQGVEIWYLKETDILLATDTNFSVTWLTSEPTVVVLYAAATYANVDQINPIVSFSSAATPNGSPNPLTTTVNVVADGYAVAVASHGKGNGGFAWNNGWASRTEQLDPGTLTGTGDHAETVDGTATASVTKLSTTSNRFVLAAVSLSPVTTPPGPNQPPVLATVAAQVVDEGQSLSFGVTATDGDGTIPILSAAGLPTGAGFVNNGDGSGSFSWTPTFVQAGVYPVTFYATDGIDTDSTSATITVNNINRAPVLDSIGPKTGIESILLSIGISATDQDGTTPGLLATSLPTGASFVDNLDGTASFNWTPSAGQAGPYSVDFIATDGSLSDSETVSITINATNQPPILATIGSQTGDEGVLLTIAVSASDGDGTTPVLSASPLPPGATFGDSLDGSGLFSWTPSFAQAGTYPVTFTAGDGIEADSETVVITIIDVNQPPTLTAIGPKTIVGGSNLNFSVTSSDPDGTTPALTISSLPGGASFIDNLDGTATFDWTPSLAQVAVYSVIFYASDGLLSDSEVVSITVTDVPLTGPITLLDVNTNNTLSTSWTVNSISPGNDRIIIWMVSHENGWLRNEDSVKLGGIHLTRYAQVNTNDGTLNLDLWYLLEADIQARTDNIVSDHRSCCSSAESECKAVLVYENVNQTNPFGGFAVDSVVSSTAKRPMTVSLDVLAGSMVISLFGEGSPVTPIWNNGFTQRTDIVANSNSLYGSSADQLYAAAQTVVVSVDASPHRNRHAVIGAVLNPTVPPGPNQAPVLATVAAQVVDEGQNLSFGVTATDGDGTIPILSAAGLPTGAGFVNNGDGSGSFSWTPTFSQAGVYPVTFYATDGIDTDSTSATITVNNINRAPVLASIGPKTGIESILLSISVSASDPDGTTPGLSVSSLPTGASFVDNLDGTGSFNWTPSVGQAGPYSVNFITTDGSLSDSETVSITINATNQPPILASIGPRSGDEGVLLTIAVSASDGDGTTPVLSASPLPPGATFTDSLDGSGLFSWTPSFAQAGTYPVTFTAFDGFDADSETVVITVVDVNRAPVLDSIGAQTVLESTNLSFIISANDPDGTTPILSVSALPAGATFADSLDGTGRFDWIPALAQIGVHDVVFVAFDGALVDTEIVSITVLDTPPPTTAISLVGSWTTGLNHAVGIGSNRLLLFTVGWEEKQARADRPVSDVAYGGMPMTQIVRQMQPSYQGVEIWYLNEADITAASGTGFNVSWTVGAPSVIVHYAAATYANVNQSTPVFDFSSVGSPNGQPNPLSTTVNVVVDGYSVAVASHGKGNGGFTWNNGWTNQTEQLDSRTLTGTGDHAETVTGTATASVTKLSTINNRFVLAAVSLAPAAGSGPLVRPQANSIASETLQPVDYRLYANYPNPFNPSTQIRFDLPVAGNVRLDVYNILGRNTATLVNGHRVAGSHTVTWNASRHASGLYLYRLRAGEFDETWKMLLLK